MYRRPPNIPLPPNGSWDVVRNPDLSPSCRRGTPSQISCRATVEVALSGKVVTSTFLSVLAPKNTKEALQNVATGNIFFQCTSGRALGLLVFQLLHKLTEHVFFSKLCPSTKNVDLRKFNVHT